MLEEIREEKWKIIERNEKKTYQILQDTLKPVLRENFIAAQVLIKESRCFKSTNDVSPGPRKTQCLSNPSGQQVQMIRRTEDG